MDLMFRSVYARMKVAPMQSIPVLGDNNPEGMEFGDLFKPRTSKWHDSQLCSVDLKRKERDAWLEAMDSNCAKGEAYCWMGCYPLPRGCPQVEDTRCFSPVTNVTCSTEPDGKPMDPTCRWECKPQDYSKGVVLLNDYCNGKTDMYMFGFESSGDKKNPCIILFFDEWTLDSRWKFGLGCFGVMMLGFSIEAVIALRRMVTRRRRVFFNMPMAPRKTLLLISFGVNLILGYLAMLVAMTYSIELFFFVILGLILGHAFFNVNTAIGESIDPCCASQNDFCSRNKETMTSIVNSIKYDDPSPRDNLLMAETRASSSPISNGSCCRNGSDHSSSANTITQQTNTDLKI